MQLDLERPGDTDLYALATHVVVPRPIAWVMTKSAHGVNNLAPFSYFGLISDDPILMVLSIAKRNGAPKDTARNLLHNGEAVLHLVEEAQLEPMVLSSKELPPSESEVTHLGLETAESVRVHPPRLARVSVALECRVDRHCEVGNDANDLFFLRAVYAHFEDETLTDANIDPQRLRVVAKLGASDYAITDVVRTWKRP